MTGAELPRGDLLVELHYALAEADSERPEDDVRARVMSTAVAARQPGEASDRPEHVSGTEVFRRAVEQLEDLLAGLSEWDWKLPALRGLDVQGLVGHLIGIEMAFADALQKSGEPTQRDDHVAATQPTALGQAGRPFDLTRGDWSNVVHRSLTLLDEGHSPDEVLTYYGVTLPLDELLVVRAFELWIHEEDIRRATGRPLAAPEPARLARMAQLAVRMVPAGMARAGRDRPDRSARLVLIGPGGGTWDLRLDAPGRSLEGGRRADTRIVVDTAAFCRVVGNRENLAGTGAVVTGDTELAADLFVGAGALALD